MPIEVESPEEFGYDRIKFNLSESSVRDRSLADLGVDLRDLVLFYGTHEGHPGLRELVVRPNYATNIETPRAIEADISFLDLTFEEGFAVDIDRLAKLITPRTKYVSVTQPHNPTGQLMSESDLRRLVAVVESAGCRLLVDEPYREMSFGGLLPCAASLSPRAISVSSLSKTYGIPGIRTGWLLTRDRELMTTFLAAKEQIGICGSVVDEE